MSQRYDYVAVNPEGVYALCEDCPDSGSAKFIADALKAGHRVDRVTVDEAVRRHKDYLRTLPEFQELVT